MFVDSLKTLSSQIFQSTASGISKVVQDPEIKSLLEKHTKEVLVTAMSSRSPFIQEIAKSILDLVKEKEENGKAIGNLLDKNKDFRNSAESALGIKDTSKISDSLVMIFREIQKSNNKESEQYKLFGKLYEEYKKETDHSKYSTDSNKESNTTEKEGTNSQTTSTSTTSTNVSSKEVLVKIEANTNQAVEKLDKLLSTDRKNKNSSQPKENSTPSNSVPTTQPSESPSDKTKQPPSQKDEPLTFLQKIKLDLKNNARDSLKSGSLISPNGIRNIGSTFIASSASSLITRTDEKVAEVIRKQIDKLFEKKKETNKEKNSSEESSNNTESSKETNREKIQVEEKQTSVLDTMLSELKKLNSSTSEKSSILKTSTSNILDKIKSSVLGTVLSSGGGLLGKVAGATTIAGGLIGSTGSLISKSGAGILKGVKSSTGSLLRGAASIGKYIPSAVKGIGSSIAASTVPAITRAAASPIASSILSGGSALASGALGAIGGVATAAAPFALPALALGGATTAGYQFGDKVLNPLIDSGISAVTGKENSLGTFLGDIFKSDSEKRLDADNAKYAERQKMLAANKISPIKTISETTDKVESMLNRKEEMLAKDIKASQQPIIVQQNSSSNSSGGSSSVIIGASKNVRNAESTYERVQMQDYWSKSF